MWRKWNPSAFWWECRLVNPMWKTAWNFLKKLKMELPYDPVISLLGIYTMNPETPNQKNLFPPVFIAALFTIAKCWKQPKCPSIDECIKNLWYRASGQDGGGGRHTAPPRTTKRRTTTI